MSKSKYRYTLSGLIESDSEGTQFAKQDAMPTPDSAAENTLPKSKGRGRVPTTKAMKAKAIAKVTARRSIGAKTMPAKKGKRQALGDRTNEQDLASDTEEVDEFGQEENNIVVSSDELDNSVQLLKQKKSRGAAASNRAGKTAKTKSQPTIEETEMTEHSDSHVAAASRKQSQVKGQPHVELRQQDKVIQETQVSMMDVDDYGDEVVDEPTPKPVSRSAALARSALQSRQPPVSRRRAGSASDTEKGDPATRRKLGDMTKKFETLDLKYRSLREIGIKEAEHNFERFKKQNEESLKGANALIASLKSELAAQNIQVKESRSLKKRVDTQEDEISKLNNQVAQLNASLLEAQTENKTLSTKLAANRSAATSVESANTKTPGSAIKANGGIRLMGSAEAAQTAQAAQLKEDLYSDLTGLIIRGVKRDAEDDVYDCIQTGRNGTLHFKLAVTNDKSAESYDEAQCIYIPQLDMSRDKALMELLPDYLVDEITFPRPQAGKFYARVMKALTEKGVC